MSITTEQEFTNAWKERVWPDDDTKTIQDVIQLLADHQNMTEDEIKKQLKSTHITDWSF